jgi:hypothetical protein
VHSYFRRVWRFVRSLPEAAPLTPDSEPLVILNRRSLLLSLGLTLPAVAAEAATSNSKKKPTHHTTKTASAKTHAKPHTHHTPAKPAQS